MIEINVPDSGNCYTDIPLGGEMYRFEFTWNSMSKAWYVNILKGEEVVVLGAKLLPDRDILARVDTNLMRGSIVPIKWEATEEGITRHNIGANKPYKLLYL